jgi:hypothetical protein
MLIKTYGSGKIKKTKNKKQKKPIFRVDLQHGLIAVL